MPNAIGPSRLVGREQESKALLALLERRGPQRVGAVVGPPGIGKTSVWLEALSGATACGYLVLSTRAIETEARFSFAALADLVGGVIGDVLPALPRPQARALEAALALSDSDAVPLEGIVAFAFLSALRQLAATRPVLVAIDDAQWLDAPSRGIVEFAFSRIGSEPIVAITTVRGDLPPWLRRAVPEDRLLTLELGPLSVGALHELLRARTGVALPRPALLRIWETSGGNPFFAIELSHALHRRGGRVDPGEEPPMPADLEELLHARLDALDAPATEVARIVAALAEPTVSLIEMAEGRRARRDYPTRSLRGSWSSTASAFASRIRSFAPRCGRGPRRRSADRCTRASRCSCRASRSALVTWRWLRVGPAGRSRRSSRKRRSGCAPAERPPPRSSASSPCASRHRKTPTRRVAVLSNARTATERRVTDNARSRCSSRRCKARHLDRCARTC